VFFSYNYPTSTQLRIISSINPASSKQLHVNNIFVRMWYKKSVVRTVRGTNSAWHEQCTGPVAETWRRV